MEEIWQQRLIESRDWHFFSERKNIKWMMIEYLLDTS